MSNDYNEGTQQMAEDTEQRLRQLEIAQATQEATMVGAEATQTAVTTGMSATNAAMQAGTWSTMTAGAIGMVVGMFLGLAIANTRS